jgi:Spy/CpxP family protein refolding chaperone
MKKISIISGIVLVLFLLISHGLYAQRISRYGPGIEDDYYDLNLTREQLEKIDDLELELEKELSPLISKLRSNYMELNVLEAQRSSDPDKIDKIWDVIYRLEDDIRNREVSHEKKVRDLLTEDQRAVFDSYFAYGTNLYGRGGFGRGYFGRGFRGFRGGNYRQGRYGYNARIGRNYLGKGTGRFGCGYYGYGRGIFRGYGRGPCGAGLGRWYRMGYGRGRWNWDK